MGVEIDWSKAPEGATHYLPEIKSWHPCWVKSESGNWYTMIADGFDASWDVDWDFEEAKRYIIPRPTAWAGEGLPPAGTVCEYQVSGGTWYQCTVRYITKPISGDDVKVVIECAHLFGEQIAAVGEVAFRPLRTPEQIAADERRAAILEMKGHLSFSDYREAEQHCAALYDAGYRKVTP